MNISREMRGILYQFYKLISRSMPDPAENIVLDLVIPVLEKDLVILPLCLEGVKRCVNHHRVDKIFLVSPESKNIRDFAEKNNLQFVEESSVLGYGPKDIDFVTDSGRNRSGWLFQQLIKLSGALGENPYYLVIDADHILLRPHTFLTKENKTLFYRNNERHLPYFQSAKRLLGDRSPKRRPLFSYVAHKMFFDKSRLADLRKLLEEKNGMPWDQAIINSLDRKQFSPFSEFELYGWFMPTKDKVSLPWHSKSTGYGCLDTYENLCRRYGKKYWAVTFPDYYNK